MRAPYAIALVAVLASSARAQPTTTATSPQPAPASAAQPAPALPPQVVVEPSPFSFGLALGGGALLFTCEGCAVYAGEAVELHVGWAFAERFEVLAQVSGVFHPVSQGWISSGSADLVARGWITRSVWLEGGAGYGRVYVSDPGGYPLIGDPSFVWSATAGGGVDVYRDGTFALSLQLRGDVWLYSDVTWSLGALVGFELREPLSWLTSGH